MRINQYPTPIYNNGTLEYERVTLVNRMGKKIFLYFCPRFGTLEAYTENPVYFRHEKRFKAKIAVTRKPIVQGEQALLQERTTGITRGNAYCLNNLKGRLSIGQDKTETLRFMANIGYRVIKR